MKIIFAVIFITCVAFSVKAQLAPNLLHNRLNDKLPTLKLDTSISKFIAPKAPGSLYDRFNLLKGSNLHSPNMPGFPEPQIVYSRMPVKRLQSGDKMPIANIDAAGPMDSYGGFDMSVKRMLVVDPLGAK